MPQGQGLVERVMLLVYLLAPGTGVLGVPHRVLGVLHRVPGVLYSNLGRTYPGSSSADPTPVEVPRRSEVGSKLEVLHCLAFCMSWAEA